MSHDAVVIGSGPNGLAAAITLARAGKRVLVLEAQETPGGGARTAPLTLPGFLHDTCSAIHPMAVASPFFREMPLAPFGLQWIEPPAAVAHPFDDGTAAALYRSIDATAETLGEDGPAYRARLGRWEPRWRDLFDDALQPLHFPRHPFLLAGFGLGAIRSAEGLFRSWFRGVPARGLFAGLAGHSFLPLDEMPSAAIALMLGLAGHAVGWPLPRGGSQAITTALVRYLESLGGEVRVGRPVRSPADLPPARAVLFDLSAKALARVAGDALPSGYRRALERFRGGPGVFKLDYALSAPAPWKAEACRRAGTVHLGGTLDEVAAAEAAPWRGKCAERPFVLVAQPSLFDPTRAPAGKHTLWAYAHVPPGSRENVADRIEAQIERFAPGFRDCVLARHVATPADVERGNANYVDGDISGGVADLRQLFFRPAPRWDPYAMPHPHWYLCSASTPPGAGVHGMCGVYAARSALRRSF